MTFREKYMEEHPNMNPSEAVNMGCPCDFGYETETNDCPEGIRTCSICWDREMPEKKEETRCSCYTDNGRCMGTKEVDLCNCGGDMRKCDFYPEQRENKMIYAHIGPTVAEVEEVTATDEGVTAKARILDSGNRRQFESGAVRDIQEGKGRCDLLPLDVVADIYEEFYSDEEPEVCEVMSGISEFQATGEIRYLYHALDNFTEFDAWSNMFLQVAIHFEEGAKKYGENNWQKGIPVHCYIDSAVRHYLKFLRGDKDEPHDRAFCWNILCAIWTCKHKPELNEYTQKDLDFPKRDYDPVSRAYDIAKSAYNGDQSNVAYALEEIVGYLGEALE